MGGGLLTIGSYFYYYSLQTYLDLLFREGLVKKKWYKQGKTKERAKEKTKEITLVQIYRAQ